MYTLEESYQLFLKYMLEFSSKGTLSHTINELDRTVLFCWTNEKGDVINSLFSFREDLYVLLKHHDDFQFAYSYSQQAHEKHTFQKFSVCFQTSIKECYRVQLKLFPVSWHVRFEICQPVYNPVKKIYTFKRLPERVKTDDIRLLETASKQAFFQLPELRLPAVTGELKVVR